MSIPLPWRAKLRMKLLLSRLPFSYASWKWLGLFQHGRMESADYALHVFLRHFQAAAPRVPFTALELGPGDSLASALVATAHGATRVLMVDAGDFAMKDPAVYRRVAGALAERGLPTPGGWDTVPEMLKACNAEYLTGGLASLRTLAAGSVDFIWSHAVLEHVRRAEFGPTLAELRRLLAPGGVMTHQVDLTDHLGGALNNLRFPEARWESEAWVKAGFYTNRLRMAEMLSMLREEGFQSSIETTTKWEVLPTPLGAMDPAFRAFGEDELSLREFFAVSHLSGS